jgi:hypothetical protein
MGQKSMLMFVDSASVAYTNMTSNFKGMSHTNDDKIDMYFESATGADTYDKVILSCTNEKQVEAMKGLSGALLGSGTKAFTVIADDVNSVYAARYVTAIDSITLTAKGSITSVIEATFTTADTGGVDNRIIATNSDSGSLFTVNAGTDAASTIYLPASPITGWKARFACNHPSDAHTITITENGGATPFSGIANSGGDIDALTGTASVVLAASDYKLGDWFECRWDGTIWLFNGQFQTDASVTAS